jgi:hypothetical protein
MSTDEPEALRDQREDACILVIVDKKELVASTTRKRYVGDRCQSFVPWGQVDHTTETKEGGISLIEYKHMQLVMTSGTTQDHG